MGDRPPLHVAFVTESYVTGTGGSANLAAAAIHARAVALARAGHRVSVVTNRATARERSETLDGIAVHRLRPFPGKLAVPGYVAGVTTSMLGLHRRAPLNVIHAHWATAAGFAGVVAARMAGVPSVVSVKGFDVQFAEDQPEYGAYRSPRMRRLVRFTLRRADGVKCISRQLRERVRSGWGVEREDVRVVHPAIEEEWLRESVPLEGRRRDASLRILTVGGVRPIKRVEDGLAAVRLLHEGGVAVRYRIVGPDRGAGAAVARMVREQGLEEIVELTGAVFGPGLKESYDWCDVVLSPSVLEGFGMTALEGMARARPVIVTERAGAADLVEDGITGFVVPPYAPHAIARALGELAADPTLLAKMSRRAHEVACRHGYDRWTEEMEGLYREVISRHPRRGGLHG